jgi:ATP-dependent helicase HrpB
MLNSLPIDAVLPQIISGLQNSNSVVLLAPAGAGKTTRVPPTLLQSLAKPHGQILMLEPRRMAARMAARRMALERDERVGQTVGYRVRFEQAVSRETQILVVTEGMFLRRLQDDPFLDGVAMVVFDEFHERRLDSDLALAMVRRVQQTVRPDLKIIAMSATLDPAGIAQYLGDCPIVESEGRLHPVRIDYLRRVERQLIPESAVNGIEQVLQQTDGDVLVFLPGVGEIMRTKNELESLARRHNLAVLPLFGDMTAEDQDKVLTSGSQRKIILSTNVAETSVTIEGVTAVVDTGLARQMQFDADIGLDRLDLGPVSKASTDQRAGRAGRTEPGICLRLWDEASQRRRPDFDVAELHRVDLSSAILRLYDWGETNVAAFPWFETPPAASIEHAQKLLRLLGAINEKGITPLGRRIVRLPVSPRIGRLLLEAQGFGHSDRAALMAALLSEREPFLSRQRDVLPARSAPVRSSTIHRSRSDVLDRLHAVEEYLSTGQRYSSFGEINRGAVKTLIQIAKQLANAVLDESKNPDLQRNATEMRSDDPDEAMLKALVAGFPDRVARRRDVAGDKGLMVGGRGVRLGPRSAVQNAPLFLCVDIDGAGTDAMVRQASEVMREWLPTSLIRTGDELFFHPTQKQVVARRRVVFDDLVLEETPTSIADPIAAAEVLFRAAQSHLRLVMPQNNNEFESFIARCQSLRSWMPELNLPEINDVFLQDVLKNLCHGRRSFSELKSAPWLVALQSELDYSLVQTIEREAPERITVSSGNRIRLIYDDGRPPVLPVRIQEVFGMKQTPRVASGRVPILLHLLAPNMRPQQITDDLASFWANTYPEVRKELKRRYPKHAWPEDPRTTAK